MRKTFGVLGLLILIFSISTVWAATQTYEFSTAGDHTFSFNIPTEAVNIKISEVLIIGGGGGGGYGLNGLWPATGGGGGSGFPEIVNNILFDKSNIYSVTIGSGGSSDVNGGATFFKINNIAVYNAAGGLAGIQAFLGGAGGDGYNDGIAGGAGGAAYYLNYGVGGYGGPGDWVNAYPGGTGGDGYARIIISYEVSASVKDQQIIAASNNIVMVGTNFNKTAVDDNISDAATSVLEINGLAQEETSYNASALGNFSNNVYKGLIPGHDYSVEVLAFSRGNDSKDGDVLQMAVALNDDGVDTWSKNEPATTNIYPWQLVGIVATVNPTGASAYERATLNTTLSLVGSSTRLITSYNAFEDAYLGGTYESKGVYGGVQTMVTNTFVLEAQGFNISILSRGITVNAPAGYNGVAVSATNIVPGCTIKYSIAIKNNNDSIATSVNLTDTIPPNCHLYYTDAPAVIGAAAWVWKGATNNNATNATTGAVKFEITIPAQGIVTASYCVTAD